MKLDLFDKLCSCHINDEDYEKVMKLYHDKYEDDFMKCVSEFDVEGAGKIICDFVSDVDSIAKQEEEKKEEKKEETFERESKCEKEESSAKEPAKEEDVHEEESVDDDEDLCDLIDDDDADMCKFATQLRFAAIQDLASCCCDDELKMSEDKNIPHVISDIINNLKEYIKDPVGCENAMYDIYDHGIHLDYSDHQMTSYEKEMVRLFFEGVGLGIDFHDNDCCNKEDRYTEVCIHIPAEYGQY